MEAATGCIATTPYHTLRALSFGEQRIITVLFFGSQVQPNPGLRPAGYVSERDALKSGLAVTPHYRYTLFFREDALLQIAAHI